MPESGDYSGLEGQGQDPQMESIEPQVLEKACSKCKEVLSADLFFRNRHTADLLEGQCKNCKRSSMGIHDDLTMQQKQCSKCKETKLATQFDRYKRTHDGLQSQCKSCMKVSHHPPPSFAPAADHLRPKRVSGNDDICVLTLPIPLFGT